MARKNNPQQPETFSPSNRAREKRKWQIALRRYVLDKSPSPSYAPYFGLDTEHLREWFSGQFQEGASWDNFATAWQFDHVIPVAFFNLADSQERAGCWNFTNLRVLHLQAGRDQVLFFDALAAKSYFQALYQSIQYSICLQLLEKIQQIQSSSLVDYGPQQRFLLQHENYIQWLTGASEFEFALLNSGKNIQEVQQEISFLRKFNN